MSIQSLNMLRVTEKREGGKIDHSELLLSRVAKLYMSQEFSDVTFEIQNERIAGHLMLLAASSEYFRALLFGGLAESRQKVIKMEVPIEAFKALLTYVYTGKLSLSEMREDNILDTLILVNQYGFTELELRISEYLCQIISMDNVCATLDIARLHGLETLKSVCHQFIDTNASSILVHESFKYLTEEALKDIIRRDTLLSPEFQIFTAVSEWSTHNTNVALEPVLSLIRLPLMTFEELSKAVKYSGFFDPNTLLEAIYEKKTSTSLEYRVALWKEENVATAKFGAHEYGSTLLDGDTTSYSLAQGYSRHNITKNCDVGIIVELGSITIINHIKLLLLDCDSRVYSYFVDVSVCKTQWERVVDRQSYHCRSWQSLYFPSRAVRYIKLVGTYSTVGQLFEVVSLEAYYTVKVPKMVDGVVVPTKNIATVEMGASIFSKDDGDKPEGMLYENSGYCFHKIGSGSFILVRLDQPYVIGSMRLKLYDLYYYSFYIATSVNNKDWEIVVDKQKQDCNQWQNLEFEPRAMGFIKIVGTKTTENSPKFCCSYFECPSSQLLKNVDDK